MSPAICCWLAVSWSTLCRIVAKTNDISLICCSSGEGVEGGAGATLSEAIRAWGAACGAHQPSCGDELAIISLAASPYDCQAKVAATPMQNMSSNRARLREARLPSDGRLMIAWTDGRVDHRSDSDRVGLSVEAIRYLPLFWVV